MPLRLSYADLAQLKHDDENQLARGGILVPGELPAGTSLFAAIDVEFVFPDASSHLARGQVVQLVPGAGVAVIFSAPDLTPLRERIAALLAPPPVKPKEASQNEKIQVALHGSKSERALIMRDTNKMLHSYVLRNPNLGLDEVLAIAKMTSVTAELLKQIAERREWAQKSDIALALVRNPKTPVPVAVDLLAHVPENDLRQMAKSTSVRPPIQAAARKRVLK